ncbi:hypothetical protein [Aestuariivirga sp.]
MMFSGGLPVRRIPREAARFMCLIASGRNRSRTALSRAGRVLREAFTGG